MYPQGQEVDYTSKVYDHISKHLNFSKCYVPRDRMLVIVQRLCPIVEILTLSYCGVNDTNLQDIMRFEWPELIQLNLDNNQITNEGVRKLTQYQWPLLTSLNLNCNRIKDKAIDYFQKPFFGRLRTLRLHGCQLTYLGFQGFFLQLNLQNVTQLTLSNNFIGNRGAKYLVKSNLINLEELTIYMCGIETEGFKLLTKAHWPRFQRLIMGSKQYDFPIELNGLQQIQNFHWNRVNHLQIPTKDNIAMINMVLLPCQAAKIDIQCLDKPYELLIHALVNRNLTFTP